MSETKFPDFNHPGHSNRYWHYADNGSLSEFDWEAHDKDIQNWFERCMADFPLYPVLGRGAPWSHREYNAWFKKWFSQFEKNSEE